MIVLYSRDDEFFVFFAKIRLKSIMLQNLPIILSGKFLIHLLFFKLFPIYLLFKIIHARYKHINYKFIQVTVILELWAQS